MWVNSKFMNLDLITKFFIVKDKSSEKTCTDFILAEYGGQYFDNCISEGQKDLVLKSVRKLKSKFSALFKKHNYILERLVRNHEKWVHSHFKVPSEIVQIVKPTTSTRAAVVGRPSKMFKDKSKKSKQNEVISLCRSGNKDPFKLLLAAHKAAKFKHLNDLAAVIKFLISSHDKPSMVLNLIKNNNPVKKKTPEEALSLILDNSLSKRQYLNMSQFSKASNCNIFPCYQYIVKAKAVCRPEGEIFTETCAEVPIQDLLNHTAKRILTYQNEIFDQFDESNKELKLTLVCSWGMDGSSGFSNYSQKWTNDGQDDDSSLFITTLNPLRLYDEVEPNRIIWNNNTPQSIRFCRPVCIKFQKETIPFIKAEKKRFDDQIRNLNNFSHLTDNGIAITVNYKLVFSLIDGKVLSAVTETASSQACPICKKGPAFFNDVECYKNELFNPLSENMIYGIQPLHMWIRCLEYCLHISYRIQFKKWQARGEDKKRLQERKIFIKSEIKCKMGLHVDQVRPGGKGTSNTGNVARRAFSQAAEFSKILDLEEELVFRLKTLLIAISCQVPLNAIKLSQYCKDTAEYIINNYGWFKIPVSVHKLLAHGADISSFSPLPLGVLGEECAEARNKYYKRDRIDHARKFNRVVNLQDVFHRAMDSSDPMISSVGNKLRWQRRQREALPKEVLELLATQDASLLEEHDHDNIDDSTCPDDDDILFPELNFIELENNDDY